MPTYTFINTETNESEDKLMSIAERDEYLKNNPHIQQSLATPNFGDPVRLGITRTPDGFNEILKNTKKRNLHSNIQTRN